MPSAPHALHATQVDYTPLSNPTLSLAVTRQHSSSVRLVLSDLSVVFDYVDPTNTRSSVRKFSMVFLVGNVCFFNLALRRRYQGL